MKPLPRYPVYIPSKGRADRPYTARMFVKDQVPFHLVVEEAEADAYAAEFGEDRILVLPFSDAGTSVPARNWIRDHAEAAGAERHWQFDDNIRSMTRIHRRERLYVDSSVGLRVAEDFTDRYENIGISGFNYEMFAPVETKLVPPFFLNCHVYSAVLVNHAMPHRWRGIYNEDTDLCLQALSTGWCTVALNAFLVLKQTTGTMRGGNEAIYNGVNDGRLKMARALERNWPGVVHVTRRYQRPQHVIKYAWDRFDVPLIKKAGVEVQDTPDNYGLKLRQVATIKSDHLRAYYDREQA